MSEENKEQQKLKEITEQKPEATLVAGFNAWQNKFKRHVNKGEKSIKILAPVPIEFEEIRLEPGKNAVEGFREKTKELFHVIDSREAADIEDIFDIDVVVELTTDEREDNLFQIFNEDELCIGDVKVDINPITAQRTGIFCKAVPEGEACREAGTDIWTGTETG